MKIKQADDWDIPMSKRLGSSIDRYAEIINNAGGHLPDDNELRFECRHLQRDIMGLARGIVWFEPDHPWAKELIRYYFYEEWSKKSE